MIGSRSCTLTAAAVIIISIALAGCGPERSERAPIPPPAASAQAPAPAAPAPVVPAPVPPPEAASLAPVSTPAPPEPSHPQTPVPAATAPGAPMPATASTPVSAPAIKTTPAKVLSVIDGDTIRVNLDGKTESVRLIGIDTPETVHPSAPAEPFGREASAFTERAVDGKTVWLEFDAQKRDRHGRLLAYVWLKEPKDDGQAAVRAGMLNAMILAEGYAQLATFPPNVKYVDIFTAILRWKRNQDKPCPVE